MQGEPKEAWVVPKLILLKETQMQQSKLEREQKNIAIIKTAATVGALMFIGFVFLMINVMGFF
jgi:hypothetical protein